MLSIFKARFGLRRQEKFACTTKFPPAELQRADSSDHIVFLIGDSLVFKIYTPLRNCFERETKAIEFVARKIDFKVPEIIQTGEIDGLNYALLTQLPGDSMTRKRLAESS